MTRRVERPGLAPKLADYETRIRAMEANPEGLEAVRLIYVTVPDPAVGDGNVDVRVIPAAVYEKLLGISWRFDDDGTNSSQKYFSIQWFNDTNDLFLRIFVSDVGNIGASIATFFFFANRAVSDIRVITGVGDQIQGSLPDMYVLEDWTIKLVCHSVHSGDQISDIQLVMQQVDAA